MVRFNLWLPYFSDKLHNKNKKQPLCDLENVFFKSGTFIFTLTNIIIRMYFIPNHSRHLYLS
ncbi:hypothetical protein XBP1_2170075 [Xenorhabdus bovienii str. puntauvense]|uniref:Uncharacterized protein n=1 Tax=Xenorhabdus bovienii str. puntauvense TaxID=1398201 RepID=A0A077NFK9_XENBV|nr:hypothetical protein XBP1_2170075 [Xenorhabdus bovienii str. puntauvense]